MTNIMDPPSNQITPSILLDLSLKTMRYVGCNPNQRNIYSKARCYTVCIIILTCFYFQGIYLGTTHYKDIGSAMIDIILFDGFGQLFMKIYILFSKHILILKLINTVKLKFWKHDNLDENQRNEIQKIYNITQISIKVYKITVAFNVFGHYVTAYLKGNGNLIMNLWFPPSIKPYIGTWPYHEIAFFIEGLIMGVPVMTVYIEIDTLFVITFAASLAQLKMLKFKMKTLRECPIKNKQLLVKCCNHHNVILEFCSDMEEMFSANMLQMLGTSGIIAVIALYSFLTEQNIIRIIEFLFMITGVACQLFVFCLIGQVIQDECLSIADAAYECNWEDIPDQTMRKTLMMMIMRSQKHVNITMGGFAVLCLETFSRVTQTMMSFLTFMLSFTE